MAVWFLRDNAPTSTIGWSAVTAWVANTVIAAGLLRRQSATPTVGNERVFVSIVAGTTHLTTEPTWTVTKGAKTTDNTVTWQECTGQPAVNGNITDTPASSTVRSTNPGLGKIVKNNAATHLFICSTAGTCGAGEPTYVTTAVGNTTTDSGCTWTYIGTSFSSWAAPHARLANSTGINWGIAGDTILFGDDHAETQAAALSYAPPGTLVSPTYYYSIDHTASLVLSSATLLPGASVSTTGSNSLTLCTSGIGNFEGITFNAGSGAVSAILTCASFSSGVFAGFKNCALKKLGTSANAQAITLANVGGSTVVLDNTTLQFGATGDSINPGIGKLTWRNTASAIAGATLPTTLLTPQSGNSGDKIISGVDLSALGSGKTLIGSGSHAAAFHLIDCKLGASVTVAATPTVMGAIVNLISSDSTATIYRQESYQYTGTLTQETTIIRTGGATDGTTPLAWKAVTTANSEWTLPFECFPISIWNSVISPTARTLTIYGIWGGGAVPNNDDIWIDVEYLGNASYPIRSVATSAKANSLASSSALSSDSSTWGGSTTKFKMAVTFTAQLAGYVRVYVKAAAASSTFYIDPKPVLT